MSDPLEVAAERFEYVLTKPHLVREVEAIPLITIEDFTMALEAMKAVLRERARHANATRNK